MTEIEPSQTIFLNKIQAYIWRAASSVTGCSLKIAVILTRQMSGVSELVSWKMLVSA